MKKIGEVQWREVGVMIALILTLMGLVQQSILFYKIAFGVLLLLLIYPILFKPLAIAWFALGHWLSKISSFIILTVVYIIVLLPIALIRRLCRKDQLKLKEFGKGNHSVFTHCAHRYTEADVLHPY